jgi:low temperature requirement protein LtrA
MKRLHAPLRLRSLGGESSRKVSWLELFFDLVFVAAVAQVAAPLQTDYSLAGLIRFTPLFALIWWAWTGHTVFSTRFESDDVAQRTLTLMQMFAVAAMAANAKDALDTRSSAGFAAAYAIVRLLLVTQYFRARRVPDARPLAMRYLGGHGVAAVLWLASALVPAPVRFWIWTLAFAIDLGTPWLALPHSVKVPPDAAHLPERFGLFTLILLGESVIGVMRGMESQEDWPVSAAVSAFLGMAIAFLIWWWYFDGALGASEQPVRSKREAMRFHVWSYAHFPLYLGIVVAGAGVERIVTAASKHPLTGAESLILAGAIAVVMVAMTAIDWTSAGHRRQTTSGVPRSMALVGATLAVGITRRFTVPVVLIAILASLCAVQLLLSLRARSSILAATIVALFSTLLPRSAFAEPEKKFAVGVVVTSDAVAGSAKAGTQLGPLFRIRSTPGLHPAFGLNWVMADLEMNMKTGDGAVGRLRLRPLMAGMSYTWIAGKLSVSPRLIAGYSFNRFRGAESVSARDSFVTKAELQVWRDLSRRVGLLGSVGYLFARPDVAGRTVNADAIRAQLGLAYAIF